MLSAAARTRARISWYGTLSGESALARVNRGLVRALDALEQDELLTYPDRLVAGPLVSALPPVTVSHRSPPVFADPPAGHVVHLQPFEYGALPKAWAEPLLRRVDEIWCYGTLQREMYVRGGFDAERVRIVPPGFDPAVFHPKVDASSPWPAETCVFLFVGSLARRKNVIGLLDAYLRAFRSTDAVALVVKVDAGTRPHQGDALDRQLTELAQRTDIPRVHYVDQQCSEGDLADFYRLATALVAPSLAEAFGLPALEAMACGVPPIVTAGTAMDDFVDESVGYRVPARQIRLGRAIDGLELCDEAWLLDPDVPSLARTMRAIAQDREEARRRGAAAAERAHGAWTWRHSALAASARIDALLRRAPLGVRAREDALVEFEARARSQNREDGMLVELFSRLGIADGFFVEFGVESGVECNAAHVARDYGWSGVMLEGDPRDFERLTQTYRSYPRVQCVRAFVTRENAVDLFLESGVPETFDLLSIDIDGNDYHLWETIAGRFRPTVVIIEYNATYPPPVRWVMAYDSKHRWAHDDYFGASLASMTALGERLGYALLATDSTSTNAIFLRRDRLAEVGFRALTPEQAYHHRNWRYPHREGPSLAL